MISDSEYSSLRNYQKNNFNKSKVFSVSGTTTPPKDIPKPILDIATTKTTVDVSLSYDPVTEYTVHNYKVKILEVPNASSSSMTGTSIIDTSMTSLVSIDIPVASNNQQYTRSFENLQTGKEYAVSAIAVTNAGESKPTIKKATTKINSIPKTINDISVSVQFTDNKPSAVVTFKPLKTPDEIGYLPITKYTAYAKSNKGDEFSAETTEVNSPSPIVIPNLKANKSTKYSVTVVATNSLGTSVKTANPAIFDFATLVPNSPVITNITKGNGEITLEFTVPYSKRPITGYVIKAFNGDDSLPICVARKVFNDLDYIKLQKDDVGKVTLTGLENGISSSISPTKDLSTVSCAGESYTYIKTNLSSKQKINQNYILCFVIGILLVIILLSKNNR